MLAHQRQELILAEVRRDGAAKVSGLTTLLGVSDMTVRRDLDVLARRGLLEKVHGGATVPGSRSTDEPGFEAKSGREQSEKDAIAASAAAMVRPGSAIGLTAGTTTFALATRLGAIPELTVVTNSPRIAEALDHLRRPDLTVVLTGGVRTPSDALVGPIAVGALRTLHIDQLFMGIHGLTDRSGFTTPNLLEAETNRAFIDAAKQVVVVADHTKWGVQGLSTITALDRADIMITDGGMSSEVQDILRSHIDQVIVVDTNHHDRVDLPITADTTIRSRRRRAS